jgi:hypothetical protein
MKDEDLKLWNEQEPSIQLLIKSWPTIELKGLW